MSNGHLPFQPFSLSRQGESSVVVGGSVDLKGIPSTTSFFLRGGSLALVEVADRLTVSQSIELPSCVMKLSSW
jgi:hypothetical protein